jgi:hypothetical protein
VIRPDILRARRAGGALDDANRIHELLTGAAAAPLPAEAAATEPAETGPAETGPAAAGTGLTAERAEELIAAIRAGRDAR